jgi:hypothetical protein
MVPSINAVFEIAFFVIGVACLLIAPRKSVLVARQLRSAAVACFIGLAVMLALHFIRS